jgi:hypothetical protein
MNLIDAMCEVKCGEKFHLGNCAVQNVSLSQDIAWWALTDFVLATQEQYVVALLIQAGHGVARGIRLDSPGKTLYELWRR